MLTCGTEGCFGARLSGMRAVLLALNAYAPDAGWLRGHPPNPLSIIADPTILRVAAAEELLRELLLRHV